MTAWRWQKVRFGDGTGGNVWYFQMLTSVADHYGFAVDTPFNQLSKKIQKIILYGSGKEVIEFSYVNDRGNTYTRSWPFEGILPNMERRFRETESSMVREELAKYMSSQPCPECDGTRLRKDARHVLIEGRICPASRR